MTFQALLATKTGDKVSTRVVQLNEQDLMPGDVLVAVDYSTVNYKDALAVTGRGPVIRQFPLIPGIDFAGTVEASSFPGIAVGDRVVANGWGLSQTHHGGYAQKARVKGEWLVKLPDAFSTQDAMAIGTAGYTAMLCVLALEHGGLTPQRGDILVTGLAIMSLVLSRAGYLYADAALGVVVALIIAWSGYQILRNSIPVLVDARAVEADRLAEIVASIPGVKGVRAARSRRTSSGHLFAEVTILVDGSTSVTDAHDFTDDVERAIARELGTAEAIVHVEPA